MTLLFCFRLSRRCFEDKLRYNVESYSKHVSPSVGWMTELPQDNVNVSLYLNTDTVLPNHPNYADGKGRHGVTIPQARGNRRGCERCYHVKRSRKS